MTDDEIPASLTGAELASSSNRFGSAPHATTQPLHERYLTLSFERCLPVIVLRPQRYLSGRDCA